MSERAVTAAQLLDRVNRPVLDAYPQRRTRARGADNGRFFECWSCGKTRSGRHNGHYWEKPREWLQPLTPDGEVIRT